MTTAWQYFTRTLSAEVLKCRRTLIFWLAAGAPFFATFLLFNIFYFKGHQIIRSDGDPNPWTTYLGMIEDLWGLFLFPSYVVLQAALLLSLEHQSGAWKHLYALAVPRWTVYFGKLTLCVGLVTWCICLLYALTEGSGMLLTLLRPELGFGRYDVSPVILRGYTKLWLAGLGIVGIQHYVSFRYPNFIVPTAFGFAMTVAAVSLFNQPAIQYIPYAFPVAALKYLKYVNPDFPLLDQQAYLSLAVFVVVSLLGCREVGRRDVT